MQTQQSNAPALADYVDLQGLQQVAGIPETFPTLDAIRWFVRRHRGALVAHGALILVAGRQRFHPVLFQDVAIAVGKAAADRGGVAS